MKASEMQERSRIGRENRIRQEFERILGLISSSSDEGLYSLGCAVRVEYPYAVKYVGEQLTELGYSISLSNDTHYYVNWYPKQEI